VKNRIKDEHEKVEFGKEVLHFLHFEVSENKVRYFAVDIRNAVAESSRGDHPRFHDLLLRLNLEP